MNEFGLVIAVPRGALMSGSVDRLEAAGLDVAEIRVNDRKLLFADVGVVTMRPSDVPTYVESGAADVGITGSDVLLEHPERQVFELADLDFGHCKMVVASEQGPDRAESALSRLGTIRVATKYPNIAAEYFEQTGRQVELVTVNGSVELAPLTGLAEAIVDLTASGATIRENGLVVREEIVDISARLIANRVSHRLKADAIERLSDLLTRFPSRQTG